MKTFYLTDAGKIRTHNEDSVIILHNDNNEYIMAVADGMGGHKAGEVASSIATEHIKKSFNKLKTMGSKEEAIEWIRSIVTEINNKIFDYTKKHDESKGIDSFVLILRFYSNQQQVQHRGIFMQKQHFQQMIPAHRQQTPLRFS